MFKKNSLIIFNSSPGTFYAICSSKKQVQKEFLKWGRGINLGNVLSAPTEGDWAVPVTEQYFIDVAKAGFYQC